LSQCNGDWEHGQGIRIYTIDNPGWGVSINMKDSTARGATMQPYVCDRGDGDWVVCEVKDEVFMGHGDPGKLAFILETFRRLVDHAQT
jgi:hypothetical protein